MWREDGEREKESTHHRLESVADGYIRTYVHTYIRVHIRT